MNVPLTFLIGDIVRLIAINQKNYFKLNKESAKVGRDHYFYFEVFVNQHVKKFKYINI